MTDDLLQDTPPAPRAVPSKAIPDVADLIWEDEPAGSQSWWLSRARSADIQLFIALDPLTASLLCLGHTNAKPNQYDVLVVTSENQHADRTAALAAAKHHIAVKIANPLAEVGRPILAWRVHRAIKLALNQAPLAASAFLLGAVLGLAVALFAVSTALVGWPMLVAGIVIGAASGPLLKLLIDRRFKSLLGPWGRFWIATLSAAAGALASAGGLLTLFWG